MATYLEQSLAKLKEFEGCVPWMYRDTVGRVTVGVGLMLPDVAAARALEFTTAGALASAEQIESEFARVMALPEARPASFYKVASSPELPESAVDGKLIAVLEAFERVLRERLNGYDSMPQTAKLALLDMAYNLGPEGLFREYPRMMEAVGVGAWAKAAGECLRHGPGPVRNAWTKAMFLDAAAGGEIAAVSARAEGWLSGIWRKVRRFGATSDGEPAVGPAGLHVRWRQVARKLRDR